MICKMFSVSKMIFLVVFFFSLFLFASTGQAAPVVCKMNFTMRSWSFIYQSGKGTGNIFCNNDQMAHVVLRGKGGGFTIGKSKIDDGIGVFSDVSDLEDLYGQYTKAKSHAKVVDSAGARLLKKGTVFLTLTGTGEGIDLGVNFGSFKILHTESESADQ